MPDPAASHGHPTERQRLRRHRRELEGERAGLAGLRTGAVDPIEREREIDEAMDQIEYELGMIEQQEKSRE